jgi:ATP synthase protein I
VKDMQNWRAVQRVLVAQLLIGLLITVIVLVSVNRHAAISALLGALVALIPSVVFAKKMFQHQGARAARQIVKNFYTGEFFKIILSVILFTLVLKFYKLVPLAFFLAYIAVIMTHWFAPLIINNKQNEPEID